MDSEMLAEQESLVELVEAAGWEVTDVELSAYESPWLDTEAPEATVSITARKTFDGDPADPDEYRVE